MGKSLKSQPIISVPAYLWDGVKHLRGMLELYPDEVHFEFKDFSKSKIELNIHIEKIRVVEEFLLFDLDRKGLRIESNKDAEDLFISENTLQFKTELDKIIKAKKYKK